MLASSKSRAGQENPSTIWNLVWIAASRVLTGLQIPLKGSRTESYLRSPVPLVVAGRTGLSVSALAVGDTTYALRAATSPRRYRRCDAALGGERDSDGDGVDANIVLRLL
jgi:hypothetical protein